MLYGARLLFDEVNLNLLPGNRYGLVGANGTGKTTFLKLLAGEETPSLGEIITQKNMSIGFLKQDQFKYEHDLVVNVVIQGKRKLWQAMQEKEELLKAGAFTEKMGIRLGELEELVTFKCLIRWI
jgi:ATPase subunit of ABC transporter with duplicated ATPase domains